MTGLDVWIPSPVSGTWQALGTNDGVGPLDSCLVPGTWRALRWNDEVAGFDKDTVSSEILSVAFGFRLVYNG